MTQLEPSRRIGADFPLSLLAATKLVGAVGIDPRPKIGRCLIAFGQADYFKINKKGVAFLSLSEITRDQAAAIREITLESCAQGPMKDGNVRRTLHLRLSDKVRCLELLGKFLKLFGKSGVSASEPVRVIIVDPPRRLPASPLENDSSAINDRSEPSI